MEVSPWQSYASLKKTSAIHSIPNSLLFVTRTPPVVTEKFAAGTMRRTPRLFSQARTVTSLLQVKIRPRLHVTTRSQGSRRQLATVSRDRIRGVGHPLRWMQNAFEFQVMTVDEKEKLRALLEYTAKRDIDLDREIMAEWADIDREWMERFDEPSQEPSSLNDTF